ncbi:MAG: oxidoreductase, partial [Gallionella sp.]
RKASVDVPWKGGKSVPVSQGGWQTQGPSAIPFVDSDAIPTALSAAEMRRIRDDFAHATKRAHRLGLDAIELHAAHGYLMHQFLSPLANHRNDQYGGTLENRMRFPLEVFATIREAFPAGKPVGVRISATDWVAGGWNIEESVRLAMELRNRGCNFIDVSSGGMSPLQEIPLAPGYQVSLATRIRRECAMPTIAVGLITDAEHAEQIVASGDADMVALARGILYDPHWPWHAAAKLGAQVRVPNQYLRSQPHGVKDLFKNG